MSSLLGIVPLNKTNNSVSIDQQLVDYNDAVNIRKELGNILNLSQTGEKKDQTVVKVKAACTTGIQEYLQDIAKHPYQHKSNIMYVHDLISRFEDARSKEQYLQPIIDKQIAPTAVPEALWGTTNTIDVIDRKCVNEDLICLSQTHFKIHSDELTEEKDEFSISKPLNLLSIKNANYGEDYVILDVKFSYMRNTGRFFLHSRFDIHSQKTNEQGETDDNFDSLILGTETLMYSDNKLDGLNEDLKIINQQDTNTNKPFVVNRIIPAGCNWMSNDDCPGGDARKRLQLLASNNFVDADLKNAIYPTGPQEGDIVHTDAELYVSSAANFKDAKKVPAKKFISSHDWFLVTFSGTSSTYKSLTNNVLLGERIYENLKYKVLHGLHKVEGKPEESHITIPISVYLHMALMYHDDIITKSTISANKKLVMTLWNPEKKAFKDVGDFDVDLIADVFYASDSALKTQSLHVGDVY